MDQALPDACVHGYETLIEGLTLPDLDDRHVLAAAIRCNASVIVTFNQKDFPSEAVCPFGIEAQHPDEFIENLFGLDAFSVVGAAQRQRKQLKLPPMDVAAYLDLLMRQGLVRSSQALKKYRATLNILTTPKQQNGDPEITVFIHSPNCRPNPPGTPWISVASHGPFGPMERLQPLFQR